MKYSSQERSQTLKFPFTPFARRYFEIKYQKDFPTLTVAAQQGTLTLIILFETQRKYTPTFIYFYETKDDIFKQLHLSDYSIIISNKQVLR